MRTTKVLTLSLPPEMAEQVGKFAQEEGMTRSELFREALRDYMRKRRWEKIREYGAKKAVELGLRNEADVERLIDEYRAEQMGE